jgi:DNA modification methylase
MSKAPILTPFLDDADVILYAGDCIDVMSRMPEASVDAIVTDPPYGLEFMGKDWDGFGTPLGFQTWTEAWAREAFRVLKPGGHLLAFAGTRTYHRMASGVEDAGFEIRDCIAWMYGSGFPKSLDVSKAIDKQDATEERTRRARIFQTWLRQHITAQQINEITQTDMGHHLTTHPTQPFVATSEMLEQLRPHLPTIPVDILQIVHDRTVESENFKSREVTGTRTVPKGPGFAGERYGNEGNLQHNDTIAYTPEAAKWNGWGTGLKPAFEPVVVARKPLIGTVAQNVLEHGTGALNIDACRIGMSDDDRNKIEKATWVARDLDRKAYGTYGTDGTDQPMATHPAGRWPANIALDATAAEILDEQSGERASTPFKATTTGAQAGRQHVSFADLEYSGRGYTDTGGASRFFYTAKASRQDRNTSGADNTHPTVKPTELMRWLIRLVTPPAGIILDPFGGSGSTGVAARAENVRCILIERETEYLEIIRNRLAQLNLLSELLDDE